jgi:branched-chain amino acid transport system permease protein
MSSKRSENPEVVSGTAGAAGRSPSLAPLRLQSLKVNGPLPLVLLALIPLGWLIESRAFGHYNSRIVMLVGFNVILAIGLQLINGFSGQFSLGHAGFMAVGAYLAAYPAITYSNNYQDPAAVLFYDGCLGVTLAVVAGALYGLFGLIRTTRRTHPLMPALLLMSVLGWALADVAAASRYEVTPSYLVWSQAANGVIAAFNWGTTHAISPAAHLSALLPHILREPICFLILVIGGGLFAAATGLVVGLPTLRLRGDYLAIATLGMAEILRIVIRNSSPLGGALGLTLIPRYTNFAWLYAAVVVSVVVVWRLAYSARGRAIQAVREDEIAAAAIGINPTRQKVSAFVVGAFFGGIAGALFSLHERSITPDYFGLQKSIEVVVIVTLGGLGSISGAILAAIVLTLLPEVLRPIADYRMVIYSLLLIVMMLLRPQGLLAGREAPRWLVSLVEMGLARLFPKRRSSAAASAEVGTESQGLKMLDPAHGGDASLAAIDVSRRFGGLMALTSFSLKIDRGELVGLIGPNGAGKTTAFNLITGVYAPSKGQIVMAGKRIDGLTPVEINHAGIARTFQNIRLFSRLSVLDNVGAGFHRPAALGFWRTILRTPEFYREQHRGHVDAMQLLETLGLAADAATPAGSLAYGQQRRLEIARALATGPNILLLDEPAAGMNPQEKRELMHLIGFIRDRFSLGIWLIEHDMQLVMGICQRITVLDHGETIAVGTPQEVQCNQKVIDAYLGVAEDVDEGQPLTNGL